MLINAASKSIFLGDIDKGRDYAAQTEKLVGAKAIVGDYWKTATIGEVLLIQKKYEEAGEMYQRAIDIAPTEEGNHLSTFNQAKLFLEKLGANDHEKTIVLAPFKNLSD